MNKYQRILQLEKEIAQKKKELKQLLNTKEHVKRGDKVIILREYEWICSKGSVMIVDEIAEGRIYCTARGHKSEGVYWIGDGDYVKVPDNE
jgi:hypothetical protein